MVRADAEVDGRSFAPALMWAAGRGLSEPLESFPAMSDFLAQRQQSLDVTDEFSKIVCHPADGKFHLDRLYLLYTIGFMWRFVGISWLSVKLFLALVFATVGLLTYLIFRLGMNRWLSVTGFLLTLASPVMLGQLPWARSLCKAPFILAIILISGYLLLRKVRPSALLALAVLAGLVTGIGFGFRQDSLIGLPPVLTAIVLGARVTVQRTCWLRLGSVVLLLVAFLIPAWPSLRMTHNTGGNNSFYLTQGFARQSMQQVDMNHGVVCPLYSSNDWALHALIVDYYEKQNAVAHDDFSSIRNLAAARLLTGLQVNPLLALADMPLNEIILSKDQLQIWSMKAELVTRRLVIYLYRTFPADVVARAYGATRRIVQNLQPKNTCREECPLFLSMEKLQAPLARHLEQFGLLYAAVSLMLISAFSIRQATGLLLLLLYFTGYTSLEFQMRHAFHLNFLSFWFPLFLLGAVCTGARHLYSCSPRAFLAVAGQPSLYRVPALRMLFFSMGVGAALSAPLYAMRLYQSTTVGQLMESYAKVDLEALPFEVRDTNGEKMYCPTRLHDTDGPLADRISRALEQAGMRFWPERNVRVEYLVAEIETAAPETHVAWEYTTPGENSSDSYLFPRPNKGSVIRFFFPVIDYVKREAWCNFGAFTGFKLGEGAQLKGLYRVRNVSDFPFLMNVWLPSDREQIRWCQEFM